MSSIDTRIVDMQFNNAQFNAGVQSTLGAVDKLKEGLKFDSISSNIDEINSKMSLMSMIGFSSVQKLVGWSMDAGKKIVSNVIDPIVQGGRKRSLNLEQAYFQLRGLISSEQEVQAVMEDVNYAVDGTAYGLDAAAMAASQFAASGVRSGKLMQDSLRGISGVAAMAGSSYEEISGIFTKVAGQGRVMGDDLLRLSARGISASATMAKHFGKTDAEIRQMVTEGKVSFEMFSEAMNEAFGEHATKANETYTGSLMNLKAAMARIGQNWFRGSDASKSYGSLERQRRVFVALIPVVDAVNDGVKKFFNSFNRMAMKSADSTVKWIESFGTREELAAKLEPIGKNLGLALENSVRAVQNLARPIKQAFNDIFDFGDGIPILATINKVADALRRFTFNLTQSSAAQKVLYQVSTVFFSVLEVGWNTLKVGWSVVKLIGTAFQELGNILLTLLQPVKEVISAIIEGLFGLASSSIDTDKNLFELANGGLAALSEKLVNAQEAIREFTKTKIAPFIDKAVQSMKPAVEWAQNLELSWAKVGDVFSRAWAGIKSAYETISPYVETLWNFIRDTFTQIQNFLGGIGLDNILKILAAGGIGMLIKSFMDANKSFSGIVEKVKDVFTSLQDTISSFANETPAKKLLVISIGILALATALLILSTIEPVRIMSSLAAVSGGMAVLLVGLNSLIAITKEVDTKKFLGLAAGLAGIAFALILMAVAIKIFSMLSWEEIAKGLGSVVVSLIVMSKALEAVDSESVLKAGLAFAALATGLLLFAGAIFLYSLIPWDTIWNGLSKITIALSAIMIPLWLLSKMSGEVLRVATALLVLVIALGGFVAILTFMSLIPFPIIVNGIINVGLALWVLVKATKGLSGLSKDVALVALALIPLAFALDLLVLALLPLSAIPFWKMADGLIILAIGLRSLVLAVQKLDDLSSNSKKLMAGAASVLILSGALVVIAIALKMVSSISWGSMLKSVLALGTVLGALVGAMYILDQFKGSSKSILIKSAIFLALAGTLVLIGTALRRVAALSWEQIGKGLFGITAVLGALALVLVGLSAVPPIAIVAVGAALALGAGGMWLVAEALLKLGTVNWDAIRANLDVMAQALALITAANLMNSLGLIGSVALIAGAAGLMLLADAMRSWEGVSIPDNIASQLLQISLGIMAFTPAVLGALSALVAGFALKLLAEAVVAWSSVSVSPTIGIQLALLAGGIKAFDDSVLGAIGALVAGFALKNLAESVRAWDGIDVNPTIGTMLEQLATGIGHFSGGDIINAIAGLVSGFALKNLADSVRAWEGIEVNPAIESQLSSLARGIGAFDDHLLGAITSFVAANPIKWMADSVRAWDGVEINPVIETQLAALARGIGAFNDTILGAIATNIAADPLGKMAQSVKEWEGVEINPVIETQLQALANGVGAFFAKSWGSGGLADSVAPVRDMAGAAKAWEGMSVPDNIEDQLKSISNGVGSFNGIRRSLGDDISAVVQPISDLGPALQAVSSLTIPSDFKDQMTSVKDGVTQIGNLDSEKLTGVVPALQDLKGAVQPWADFSIGTGVVTSLGELGTALQSFTMLSFDDGVVSRMDLLKTSATNLGTSISTAGVMITVGSVGLTLGLDTMASSVTGVQTSLENAAGSVATNVAQLNTSLQTVGSGAAAPIQNLSGVISTASITINASVSGLYTTVGANLSALSGTIQAQSALIVVSFITMNAGMQSSMLVLASTVETSSTKVVTALRKIPVGVTTAMGQAVNAVNNGVSSLISGAINKLNSAQSTMYYGGYRVGMAIGQGMVSGILNGRSSVINAAASVATSALTAAKARLGVESPSKEFRIIGGYMVAGMVLGLMENQKKAATASETLAETAIGSAIRIHDELQDLLDDGLISDPVITPVLDTSTIQRQMARTNGLVSPGASMQLANGAEAGYSSNRELERINEAIGKDTTRNEVTITQNNTSPKALSAAEIYRQTKNLVSTIEKGLDK